MDITDVNVISNLRIKHKYIKYTTIDSTILCDKANFILKYIIGFDLSRIHPLYTINSTCPDIDEKSNVDRLLVDPEHTKYILLKDFHIKFVFAPTLSLVFTYNVLRRDEYNRADSAKYYRFPYLQNAEIGNV